MGPLQCRDYVPPESATRTARMKTHIGMDIWKGRVDADEGLLGRRWHQLVKPMAPTQGSGVALIGFACDAGVARNHGRRGAAEGPTALRKMLCNMPAHRSMTVYDAGDIVCEGDELERAQAELSDHVADTLDRGFFPMVLGGGHEVALGSFGGLARHLERSAPVPRIGIVNLDAHFDLRRDERATSGTPFRQIALDCAGRRWPFHYCCLGVSGYANTEALFARARELGVVWRRDDEMGIDRLEQTMATLHGFLAQVDHAYLTICLDVLPAAVAPGVSAPGVRGVPLEVVEPIVDAVAGCGKLQLAEIAELNPSYDIDHQTARVAARLAARIAKQRDSSWRAR